MPKGGPSADGEGKPFNHVRWAACRCGPPPDRCVPDGAVLTQYGVRRAPFRNQPRIGRELGLSVLRGRISLEDAVRYVLKESPTEHDLRRARIRRTTVGELRLAGFAVVHTPGRVRGKDAIHCTVAWPETDPIDASQVPWPAMASERFDACFNEVWEEEPDEL